MNRNLKNRPKLRLGRHQDYEEWFEDFEKELRERLEILKQIPVEENEKMLIKEILGE